MHHIHDVGDHQHSDEPPGVVGHGGGNQVVLLELVGHRLLIVGDLEHGVFGFHERGNRRLAPASQNARQLDRADQMKCRIDDVDLHEFVGKSRSGPHVVDCLADRPEGGNRHELRLHQSAGGVFGVLQRPAQRCAVGGRQLGQDLAAVGLVQILNQINGIVRIELVEGRNDDLVRQHSHEIVAHRLIEFRQRSDVETGPQ